MTNSPDTESTVGVRTFLIADVRGYTRYTLEQGDEAAARLAARFADVIDESVRHHAGEVVELRGDEALAVFHSPRAALRAALDIQERFARERQQTPSLPLLVGIGLDAGEAIPVKGGFRGGALNLAARLCSVAAAGEVLASEGVIHLARKTEGIRFVDGGGVQLKGFAEEVRFIRVLPATDDVEPESASVPERGFQLRLMGGYELRHNGHEIATGAWQPRARSLFTLVASSPHLRRSRDELIDLLWPDATPEAGASNLRYTVHLLRRAFGELDPTPLLTQGGFVQLNPTYQWDVDVHRFEALADERGNPDSLARAAALYGGELLPEYRYEDWAAPLRERVQRLWRDVCLGLAHADQDQGRFDSAARWYDRLLESDPLDEETVQRLIQVMAQTGRHADAVRVYTQFAARLRRELDLEPATETLALVEHLRTRREQEPTLPAAVDVTIAAPPVDVAPTYPLPIIGRLAGREADLASMRTMLVHPAAADPLRLVLVSAEAGMGKTRLLAEVAALARAERHMVLAGGCYEEEGRLPWGPIHDALLDYVRAQPEDELRRELDDLLPVLAQIVPEIRARLPQLPEPPSGDTDAQRLRLFTTVSQVLERISRERPLILILDDLHWADDVTLQILHFLVRQPGLEHVRLVGAFRSDEVVRGSQLDSLRLKGDHEGAIRLVSLQPLSSDDLAVLLEDRLHGACSDGFVRGLHRRSAGNAFFTIQMARLLEQEGGLSRTAGKWELAPDTQVDLPPAVRETVGRRLRHIDADVRTILSLGAVLGREFDYAPLEAMSDVGEDALFIGLDGAHEAGLLRESGEGYAFIHPLLWEVVYDRIPDQRRRRLHERAGRSLENLYGKSGNERVAELAWHFVESGNRERGLLYTLQAADQAEGSVAHTEAERYFRQAIDLARSLGDQERLAQALEGLGTVLKAEARLQEASERLDEAAQIHGALGHLDDESRVVAQLGLTWYFTPGGLTPEHVQRLQSTIRRVEARDTDQPSLALAQLWAALPRLLSNRPEEELVAARRASEMGRAVQDPTLEAAGYLRQGSALLLLRRHEEASAALDRAVTLSTQTNDLFTLTAGYNFGSMAAARLGNGRLGLELSRRAFAAAEARGGLEQMLGVAETLHVRAFVHGDWELGREVAERHLGLARALLGEDSIPTPYRHLAELCIHRGMWHDAERYLERAAQLENAAGFSSLKSQMLRAELALLRAAAQNAVVYLQNAPRPEADEWESELEIPRALVLAAMGDPAAEEAARRALQDAERRGHNLSRWEASHALGVALRSVGRHDEAIASLEEALPAAHDFPYPYLEGRLHYELGRNALCRQHADAAREHFEAALPLFRGLGARPYVDRTETELAKLDR